MCLDTSKHESPRFGIKSLILEPNNYNQNERLKNGILFISDESNSDHRYYELAWISRIRLNCSFNALNLLLDKGTLKPSFIIISLLV